MKLINSILTWGIKLASMFITAPATWIVSGTLFADIQNPTLIAVMRFSAVFLVEGVFLSNWILLEHHKKADTLIKTRYALTSLVMYTALFVIGVKHEGFTGVVFRLALLIALVGSGWDTYVNTFKQVTLNTERSPLNSLRYRNYARKVSITEAIMNRQREHEVYTEQCKLDKQVELHTLQLDNERKLNNVNLHHKKELVHPEQVSSVHAEQKKLRRVHRSPDKSGLRQKFTQYMQANPQATMTEAAEVLGVCRQTLYNWKK